jgi:hypothetical protein
MRSGWTKRNLDCRHYSLCLSEAAERNYQYFSCTACDMRNDATHRPPENFLGCCELLGLIFNVNKRWTRRGNYEKLKSAQDRWFTRNREANLERARYYNRRRLMRRRAEKERREARVRLEFGV